MFAQYPVFQSHIDMAHTYWAKLLTPGDIAIDATCGNGHDSCVLFRELMVNTSPEKRGTLIAMDIKSEAIAATRKRLANAFSPTDVEGVRFIHGCHSRFPENIAPESVKLIVYNLGYLPGSDKRKTTLVHTTLRSVENALPLIESGGAISITCYPGHQEGQKEEYQLLRLMNALSPHYWNICHHRWLNRNRAPSLIFIQRRIEACPIEPFQFEETPEAIAEVATPL